MVPRILRGRRTEIYSRPGKQSAAAGAAAAPRLCASDAILIASPEYAHGVPGAFKNALDWVAACAELVHKPVLLLNASSRAVHAQAALAEIIVTMNLKLLASVAIPVKRDADADSLASDSASAASQRQAPELVQ